MKDFPFGLAFILAILLHTLVGLALRHDFLIAAAPLPSANQPVSIRIVDVPKGGPSLDTPPPTSNFSDANRKAGPLVATQKPPALHPPPEMRQRSGGPSASMSAR